MYYFHQFIYLNRDQVKRVFDLYQSTINLKNFIAKLAVVTTDGMITDPTKSMSIDAMIGILANVYYESCGLPDKLREFLLLCCNMNNSCSEGIWLNNQCHILKH